VSRFQRVWRGPGARSGRYSGSRPPDSGQAPGGPGRPPRPGRGTGPRSPSGADAARSPPGHRAPAGWHRPRTGARGRAATSHSPPAAAARPRPSAPVVPAGGQTAQVSGERLKQPDRPGELVHLDVKKLGRTPTAVATAPTAAPPPSADEASAMTTCTRRSMTALGSPSARSCPMRPAGPLPVSGRGSQLLSRAWRAD
jgi:hypothetical protein